MKKSRKQDSPGLRPVVAAPHAPTPTSWFPWVALAGAIVLAFVIYGPALGGPFLLDDNYASFSNPERAPASVAEWLAGYRPFLQATYGINYAFSGAMPGAYHLVNVVLHALVSFVVGLVILELLAFAPTEPAVNRGLAIFGGALFLVHPLQTESVAYISSRSEVLSALLYLTAYLVFLRRGDKPVSWIRAAGIALLFGAAVSTKEHTVTLPVLLILTDVAWRRVGLKSSWKLWALLGAAGAAGGAMIWRTLRDGGTVGFGLKDLSPAAYFFTQCRVLLMYLAKFVLPVAQNVDPDVPVSQSLVDHGAIIGLVALLTIAGAAWYLRKSAPLAALGIALFFLTIGPTSSLMPIADVYAERRVYLPMLGLTLVAIEALRRLPVRQVPVVGAVVVLAMAGAAYARSAVWSGAIPLWSDAAAKSPKKVRPQFQLAYAYYSEGRCDEASRQYAATSALQPPDVTLYADWALALDCQGKSFDAIEKLREAVKLERSGHLLSQIGMIYAKNQRYAEALDALAEAEQADPRFSMTFVYRGNIHEVRGEKAEAEADYRHALGIEPKNQAAADALRRVQ